MKYKTLDKVLEEGNEYHKRAQDASGAMPKAERVALYQKACRCYEFILEHAPDEPNTLGMLGALYVEIGKWGLGAALLTSACQLQPDEIAHWNGLGVGYIKMRKFDAARVCCEKALKLSEKLPPLEQARVMHNLATICINEGKTREGIVWTEKALALPIAEPERNRLKFNAGMAYLELGDYERGWDYYELGRIATTWQRNYSRPDRLVDKWNGEKGKRVVVFGEQGVGDEILFASCLPDLIKESASVVIECHPRLENLFKRSFPDCPVYGTRKRDDHIEWPSDHDLDSKVPIGSLHRFYRRAKSEFPKLFAPYIVPDPARVGQLANERRAPLRVGLSWIGGTRDTDVTARSLPLDRLAPILGVPGVEFVSLQYTDDADQQVAQAVQATGCNLWHSNEMNADLDELFALIKTCDLIVTVLTSNVHFAGSMGVPAWVLVPAKAPWQFTQEIMPWYPQHRLYRQERAGEWDDVIGRIAGDLQALTLKAAAE